MKPPRFEYVAPTTLDEALALADAHGERAKVLAGGQSLIPMMKLRFAAPSHLVDINRIEGLDAIQEVGDELHIGALVRHNELAGSELINSKYPMIAAAAPQIADPLVRNLGTIGGSLTHCDPSGDLGAVMLAAPNARVTLRSTNGERDVAITLYTRAWPETRLKLIEPHIVDPFYVGRLWRDMGFARAVTREIGRAHLDLVQSHERLLACDLYRAGDGVHARARERREWPRFALVQRAGVGQSQLHRHFVALRVAAVEHAEIAFEATPGRLAQRTGGQQPPVAEAAPAVDVCVCRLGGRP